MAGIYLPTSMIWLKTMNKLKVRLFPEFTPYQLQHFSLMYFASKEALLFDLAANHILYQGFFAIAFLGMLSLNQTTS
jgi:hypothetical protein